MKRFWDWELFGALVIALMPFLLGALAFEAYGPSRTPLIDLELCNLNSQRSNLDSGKITYVAVTNLHFFVCVIVILRYFIFFIDILKTSRKCDDVLRGFIGPTVFVLLLLFSLLFFDLEWAYSRLASDPLLDIYCISDIPKKCSPAMLPVFSKFEFGVASTLPAVAAVMAAASLVIYTSFQVHLFVNSGEHERGRQFSASYQSIMSCLPMYSCILVTSVISSAVWFHLPLKIFENVLKDESALLTLRNYADEMTLFLGVTYTLIVLVAIAWPIWRLSRKAHEVGYALELKSDRRGTNRKAIFLANKILAVLAPLVTSLLYNWLEGSG